MSPIRLASGINPPYVPRATAFLKSAPSCGVDVTIFAVNFPPGTTEVMGNKAVVVDYARCPVQFPKVMLQSGAFTLFAPADWREDDVIVFTDADAYFQRAFSDAELALFAAVPPGMMMAGYNKPNEHQSLLSEARDLSPTKPMRDIIAALPGMDEMVCRNWGFVVGTLATWRELHRRTLALWPTVDACFQNAARVQLVACYACQSDGMGLLSLPHDTHAHSHHSIKEGLVKGADGIWRQSGEIVAFAHAL